MTFFHVDPWNTGVLEYLMLTGTDDIAAIWEGEGENLMLVVHMWVREKQGLL